MKRLLPVFLLTFVNTLGFSLLIPVLPIIVRDWGMPDWTFGVLLAVYSLCLFWAAPIFGRLSDQYGRRRLLLYSQAGTLLSWIAFAGLWFLDTGLGLDAVWLVVLLMIIRVIDGLTGGNSSVLQAYMSDISTAREKAAFFSYTAAVFGVGMIVGPAIGAYTMATPVGYLATTLFGVALSFLTLVLMHRALPESLRETAPRVPVQWLQPFRLGTAFRDLAEQPVVRNVMVVNLLQSAALAAYVSIVIFYLIDQIGLDETEVGHFLFVVGGFAIFNQLVMVKPLVARLGSANALGLGLLLMTLGLCALPFIHGLWVLVPVYYVLNLGISICIPTMKAVVSNESEAHRQGEMLGLFESINSLMFGIMPVISTAVYGGLLSASFLLWGVLAGLGFVYLRTRCAEVMGHT
ncbi:MAG: MFS transporter [Gammaproteobacteria bacterium]